MSQNNRLAGTRTVTTSLQYLCDNDDPEIQDIKCDVCSKVFTRLEHLRRHKRAHSTERPFACVECKRQFARLDVLRRHQSGHDLNRRRNVSDSIRRYSRACFACASARVKCFGGIVCQRCRSRDLQCEYPSRRNHSRTISEMGGQSDRVMIETDDNVSCMTPSPVEGGSSRAGFGLVPKEHIWSNQLLEVMEPNSSSVRQLQGTSSSEVASAATCAPTLLSDKSTISTGGQLLPENFIDLNETIIAGAQLTPHVSDRNIGSIYNYSAINWLPPKDLSQINGSFGVSLLQSTKSSNALSNEDQEQNMQPGVRQVNVSPGHSNRSALGRTPPEAIGGSLSEGSMHSVDGDGARLSILAGQDCSPLPLFGVLGNNSLSPNSRDDLEVIPMYPNSEYAQPQIWISEESYVALTNYLKHTSWQNVSPAHIDTLPSLQELNIFARLYFDKFHESFPLLHKGTFLNNGDGCLLELAISAIGACYVRSLYARKCSESLHELLHELLKVATISEDSQHRFPGVFGIQRSRCPEHPTRLQAQILNVLGMFHSGNPRLATLAREDRAILVTNCIEGKILMSNHYDCLQGAHGIEEEGDRSLQQWLEGELKCRAGYFVWMLDCMMAYETDFRSHMDLSDGKAPLPCPEQIWDEPVPLKAQLLILNSGPPSLCFALDMLYTEKILLPNLGELSRVILIHGMYRRVWEVGRYHNVSLSDWVPTALSEPPYRAMSENTITPPSKPVVSRWINGSCDCLDVLHWSAQSTILQASGLEHPTILHLHLARLILLAPVADLQELAKAKLPQTRSHSESYLYSTMQEHALRNSLLKWVEQDQYKARLAIIHAGSVFWYLRRYSSGAVIEPFANYMATLVIWAYSVSTSTVRLLGKPQPGGATYQSQGVDGIRIAQTSEPSRQSQDRTVQPQQPTSEDNASLNYYNPSSPRTRIAGALEQLGGHETYIIQLDRPCDDELVQLFVCFGDQMTPYMARIGDIECKDSAGKILREGIRLLSSHYGRATDTRGGGCKGSLNFIWGAAENYISMLSALATTSQAIAVVA